MATGPHHGGGGIMMTATMTDRRRPADERSESNRVLYT